MVSFGLSQRLLPQVYDKNPKKCIIHHNFDALSNVPGYSRFFINTCVTF